MHGGRQDDPIQGLSTLLLLSLCLLSGSFFLFLLPFNSLKQVVAGNPSGLDIANAVLGGGAAGWTLVIFIVFRAIDRGRLGRMARHAHGVSVPAIDSMTPSVNEFLRKFDINVLVSGDPSAIVDDGRPVAFPPRITRGGKASGAKRAILMSSLAWRRLQAEPDALAAVPRDRACPPR